MSQDTRGTLLAVLIVTLLIPFFVIAYNFDECGKVTCTQQEREQFWKKIKSSNQKDKDGGLTVVPTGNGILIIP